MTKPVIPLQKIAGARRTPNKKFDLIRWGKLINEYDFSKPHRHNYYEILIFFKGGGLHEIDFNQHQIRNCSIHFVAANSVHLMRRDKRSDGASILFSDDFFYGDDTFYQFFRNLGVYNGQNNVLILSKKEFSEFEALYMQMESEFEKKTRFSEIIIKSLLLLFLTRAELHAEEMHPFQSGSKIKHPLVEKYRSLVELYFLAHKSVKEYAAELHVSPKHLNDLCKQHYSLTAQNIIHQRLLLEIKRMLVHTDLSVKEVCFRTGFDDPAHFNHFFRFHLDITPLEYRKTTR